MPDTQPEFVGLTADRRFGIRVPARTLREITSWCEKALGRETGGLLIGTYAEDDTLAVVSEALPAPVDSEAGRSWFKRGTRGLRGKLLRRWRTGRGYYLGEWHYHPGGRAAPSEADARQMQAISASDHYACPAPVLLIVGWALGSFEIRCYVFPVDEAFTELTRD